MHTETCQACGAVMEFDRHPADWPNHPAGVRVAVECHECGHAQFTEGITEQEHSQLVHAKLTRQVADEVAARMNAPVEDVVATEAGGGADVAG